MRMYFLKARKPAKDLLVEAFAARPTHVSRGDEFPCANRRTAGKPDAERASPKFLAAPRTGRSPYFSAYLEIVTKPESASPRAVFDRRTASSSCPGRALRNARLSTDFPCGQRDSETIEAFSAPIKEWSFCLNGN
jgi:hypothetical protein